MAGLHLIKTYSSDSDEDKYDEEKEDDDKIVNKYINYIFIIILDYLLSFKFCLFLEVLFLIIAK